MKTELGRRRVTWCSVQYEKYSQEEGEWHDVLYSMKNTVRKKESDMMFCTVRKLGRRRVTQCYVQYRKIQLWRGVTWCSVQYKNLSYEEGQWCDVLYRAETMWSIFTEWGLIRFSSFLRCCHSKKMLTGFTLIFSFTVASGLHHTTATRQ